MKKTKIIATIGPVTESSAMLKKLAQGGVNVTRLNFSHGTYEWFQNVITRIKEINAHLEEPMSIMLDTKGPEIRTTPDMATISVKKGKKYTMAPNGTPCDIPVAYEHFVSDCKKGQLVQIDGGKIQAKVVEKTKDVVVLRFMNGGTITPRRHVNLPGVHISLPILGEQDKKDIAFGISAGIDLIAASFVNTAHDILVIREEIKKHTTRFIPIIAKIESQTALKHIDSIMKAADAIMIARGDLGVEIPFYKVATVQQMLIQKAILAKKPVIMATQMLASMVTEPTPTRAEITDVANAVYSQADCIMLSDETTVGKFPLNCIDVMKQVAKEVEKTNLNMLYEFPERTKDQEWELLKSGVEYAENIGAQALLLITDNKDHIRFVNCIRSPIQILLVTTSADLAAYATLMRGVKCYVRNEKHTFIAHEYIESALIELKKKKYIKEGEKIITFFDMQGRDDLLDTMQLRVVS